MVNSVPPIAFSAGSSCTVGSGTVGVATVFRWRVRYSDILKEFNYTEYSSDAVASYISHVETPTLKSRMHGEVKRYWAYFVQQFRVGTATCFRFVTKNIPHPHLRNRLHRTEGYFCAEPNITNGDSLIFKFLASLTIKIPP